MRGIYLNPAKLNSHYRHVWNQPYGPKPMHLAYFRLLTRSSLAFLGKSSERRERRELRGLNLVMKTGFRHGLFYNVLITRNGESL